MSPIFLRVWYQRSATSLGGVLSLTWKTVSDSPGLVYERILSAWFTSCSVFSILSVTWSAICCAVAPGQKAWMTMARKVNGGSSSWPSWK